MGQNLAQKLSHEPHIEKYARTPESVLYDRELSASARCVYTLLSRWVFQGSTAKMGTRKIASDLGFSRTTVDAALVELAERKHLTVHGEGKRRRMYHLTSNIFGRKQRAGVEEVALGPSGQPRLVSAPRRRTA
jgi:hypothetical protein